MAQKRMFSIKITDSDSFLDMPHTTQNLYFHLNMHADDDGFVNNPKKIQRMVNCNDDDMKLLIVKNFIILFESGIIVIKHWKMHNYIQKDRYRPSDYIEEKSELILKENGVYTKCIQNVDVGKVSIDKISIDKINNDISAPLSKEKKYHGEFNNVALTDDELSKLKTLNILYMIDRLSIYIESTGKKYKSHYATILNWKRRDDKKQAQTQSQSITQTFEQTEEKEMSDEELKEIMANINSLGGEI